MREVERLPGKIYTMQINVPVTPELKKKFESFKKVKKINTAAEIRKALELLACQLDLVT